MPHFYTRNKNLALNVLCMLYYLYGVVVYGISTSRRLNSAQKWGGAMEMDTVIGLINLVLFAVAVGFSFGSHKKITAHKSCTLGRSI